MNACTIYEGNQLRTRYRLGAHVTSVLPINRRNLKWMNKHMNSRCVRVHKRSNQLGAIQTQQPPNRKTFAISCALKNLSPSVRRPSNRLTCAGLIKAAPRLTCLFPCVQIDARSNVSRASCYVQMKRYVSCASKQRPPGNKLKRCVCFFVSFFFGRFLLDTRLYWTSLVRSRQILIKIPLWNLQYILEPGYNWNFKH